MCLVCVHYKKGLLTKSGALRNLEELGLTNGLTADLTAEEALLEGCRINPKYRRDK